MLLLTIEHMAMFVVKSVHIQINGQGNRSISCVLLLPGDPGGDIYWAAVHGGPGPGPVCAGLLHAAAPLPRPRHRPWRGGMQSPPQVQTTTEVSGSQLTLALTDNDGYDFELTFHEVTKGSFCDTMLFVVCHACMCACVNFFHSLKPLIELWPNFTGMVPWWSPTKVVQTVCSTWLHK